jgi:hypothetical protein
VCAREAPGVAQVARQNEADVEIIGVAGQDSRERMVEFVETHDVGMIPHVVDEDRQLWRRFGIPGHGAWVFIDGASGTSTLHIGELGADGLLEQIEELSG